FRLIQGGGAVGAARTLGAGRQPEARERRAWVGRIAADQLAVPPAGLRPVVATLVQIAQDVKRAGRRGIGGVRSSESRQRGDRRRIAQANEHAGAAVERQRATRGVASGGGIGAHRFAQATGRYEQLAIQKKGR